LASVRILIVDDYDFWRYCVVSMLKEHPEFEIVGEGSDGVDAIEMSTELQPDIVLLDVGLPELNGFEAAREIRRVSSGSKIVFVSQTRSEELVDEARKIGAQGFVSKMDAGNELVPAMKAALAGEWHTYAFGF
jgi:two-component system, chemotaxis family, chemotaxis protein CheY